MSNPNIFLLFPMLRVPIAVPAFYESYLWILQTLLLMHPDLHPGLLDEEHRDAFPSRSGGFYFQ
jgi:hypothetical protein